MRAIHTPKIVVNKYTNTNKISRLFTTLLVNLPECEFYVPKRTIFRQTLCRPKRSSSFSVGRTKRRSTKNYMNTGLWCKTGMIYRVRNLNDGGMDGVERTDRPYKKKKQTKCGERQNNNNSRATLTDSTKVGQKKKIIPSVVIRVAAPSLPSTHPTPNPETLKFWARERL